mmetsp:Transcript_6272/g.23580  ORF Transcript_6272/g.23580 Transcript_6272/m.23580 type:complete len:86 (+) Transcript_6272:1521-1778(+)
MDCGVAVVLGGGVVCGTLCAGVMVCKNVCVGDRSPKGIVCVLHGKLYEAGILCCITTGKQLGPLHAPPPPPPQPRLRRFYFASLH